MIAHHSVPNLKVGSTGRGAAGSGRARRGLVVVGLVVLLGAIQNPVSEWLTSMRLTPQPEFFTELSFAEPARIVDLMQMVAADRRAPFVIANREDAATTYRWVVYATKPDLPKRRVASGTVRVESESRAVVDPAIPWTTLTPGTRIDVGLAHRQEAISFTLAGGLR